MATLKHEEAFLSIFGPRPFGISRLELGKGEENALIGIFTTHHFDRIFIYTDSAERGPASRKFLTNACTANKYKYTMMENDKEVTIHYTATPVVVLGDIKISQNETHSSFQSYGYGYNFDAKVIGDDKLHIGQIKATNKNNLLATMVVREVTKDDMQLSLHYELHVCLT